MKLYIDHYSKIYEGQKMAFAAREGVLRDYHDIIMNDLKFISRKGIIVKLFHNIGRNKGNTKFLNENIISKLPSIELERAYQDKGLYSHILSTKQEVNKLMILERQYLIGDDGKRINTISTDKLKTAIEENDVHNLGISNINFRGDLLDICKSIKTGNIGRVHVLPAGRKNAIKHELFSLEGSGTLIGDNFGNPRIEGGKEGDEEVISGVLYLSKNQYLKPREKNYIKENIANFKLAKIDGIPVGCVEVIRIDEKTIELGALAVIESFLSLKIGITLIEFVESYAKKRGLNIISLTNNKKLQDMYNWRGFQEDKTGKYSLREDKSPGVQIFILQHSRIK